MSEDKSPEQQSQGADKAAAKIQAGFRGYKVRKRLQEEKEAKDRRNNDSLADDNQHLTMEEEEEVEEESGALEDKSATKIQAGVRGFLVRKRQQAEQAAATKIQAGFRGFRTRKLLKQNGQ